MHRERLARWGSVVVVEVVDEFLRADRVPHRDVPVAEKAARDCVGSRIDVGREDGGGLVAGVDERVVGIKFEENRFVRHIKRRRRSADVASRRPAGLALVVSSNNFRRWRFHPVALWPLEIVQQRVHHSRSRHKRQSAHDKDSRGDRDGLHHSPPAQGPRAARRRARLHLCGLPSRRFQHHVVSTGGDLDFRRRFHGPDDVFLVHCSSSERDARSFSSAYR